MNWALRCEMSSFVVTNGTIEKLIDVAHRIIGAIRAHVPRRRQLRILELEGTIEYDPDYDYKAERWRTR